MESGTQPARITVVGSGLAGYGVLRELRRLAPDAALTLITADDGHFYSKPAISTAFAKGKVPEALVTTPAAKNAAQLNLDLRARCCVEAIDPVRQVLTTTAGSLAYDKLVLALGAEPVRLPLAGNGAGHALSVNTLDEYRIFRERLVPPARVLIMGAGLVGVEFANDLVASGFAPIVVDPLPHPLAQLVPSGIGTRLRDALAAAGVTWHLGRKVLALHGSGPALRATLDDGTVVEGDAVLSCVGLRPRTALARSCGLEVGRGIKVDATGRTSDPHIYAIGDCAEYECGLAAYVTPIMAAARGIAPSLLGKPTPIRFPALSVQVKTTALPIVLLPPRPGQVGRWRTEVDGPEDMKYLFEDAHGRTVGYVLTGKHCEERMSLDRTLSAQSTI